MTLKETLEARVREMIAERETRRDKFNAWLDEIYEALGDKEFGCNTKLHRATCTFDYPCLVLDRTNQRSGLNTISMFENADSHHISLPIGMSNMLGSRFHGNHGASVTIDDLPQVTEIMLRLVADVEMRNARKAAAV